MSRFSELIKGDKPVLVDFYADWCGPCKTMAPVLEELKTRLGQTALILKIDVDKNPQAAQAYNVSSVPTLLIFHRGEIKWRQSGVVPATQLASLLQRYT